MSHPYSLLRLADTKKLLVPLCIKNSNAYDFFQKVHYFATGEFLKNFGAKNYRDIVQKKEIAEAVELLGCWYIDKKRDFSKGIEMWIWALMIRGEG